MKKTTDLSQVTVYEVHPGKFTN